MLKKSIIPAVMIMAMSGFVSCSKLDEMGKNAEEAKDNSGSAAKSAGESREEIANSRMLQRSGGSSTSRREALDALMSWKSFDMKVTEASKFVKGLEFQTWTGQKYDTEEYLHALYDDAIKEFFRAVKEVNGDAEIHETMQSPFRIGEELKDRDLNVYAMAVAMHGVHNVQKYVTAPREKREEVSIYDLIKRGLEASDRAEKGEINNADRPQYQLTVEFYKEQALKLISIRANMLLTMNLVRVSNLKQSKVDALILGSNLGIFKKKFFNSKFPELNYAQKVETNKYLDAARKVKVFLNSIGKEVEIIDKLKTYYAKMRLPKESEISTMSTEDTALMSEHKDLLGNFFKVDGAKISNL